MKNPRDIIIRPIISEKSMARMRQGKYTFEVLPGANKTEIKAAVEQIFSVHVVRVNTSRQGGKLRRMGRFSGLTPQSKKAVVTLEAGQKIKAFEGMM
jgi:large subunit ribosomal protein L23